MKKGFTLIELLAVIVILTIIALIATPIVLNIINDVKINSIKASLNNIDKAAELYYHNSPLTENKIFECSKGICQDNAGDKLEISGTVPSSGSINISKSGYITYDSIIIDGYLCDKYNDEFICNKTSENVVETKEKSIAINNTKEALTNYKIYGNSVQNGMSSIQNPIEIKGVGDKTINLFNFDMIKGQTNGSVDYDNKSILLSASENLYIIGQSFTGVPTAFENFNKVLNITEPDYYCLKVKIDSEAENIAYRSNWLINVTGNGAIAPTVVSSEYKNGYLFIKYNITEEILNSLKNNAETFRLFMYAFRYVGTQENVDVTASEFMFVKGDYTIDTMPSYEPYDKYKIPVKVTGKNLLSNDWKESSNWYKYGDNNESPYLSYLVGLKSNTTYTISKGNDYITTKEDNSINMIINSKKFTTSLSSNTDKWLILPDSTINSPKSVTMTTDEDGVLLLSSYDVTNQKIVNTINLVGDIQIEEGSLSTNYEPYHEFITNIILEEPLIKIGNYIDYIDYKNKKLIRNVGVLNLTGEEEWLIGDNYFSLMLDSYPKLDKGISISNYLVYEKDFWFEGNILNVKIVGINNIDDFKTWLKNNNVKIYYPLKKSIISDIELPEIKLNNNYSNISFETTINPSKALLEY